MKQTIVRTGSARDKHRRWRTTRFVVLALLALGGCSSDPSEEGTVLRRGLASGADSMDPQRATSIQAQRVLGDLFQGLLEYSAGGEIVPGVAESWRVSDDGLRYVFNLRKNAKWSNGESVTAHDFVFAFQRLVNPETGAFYADFLRMIRNAGAITSGEKEMAALGVVAQDDYTLEFELIRPTPYFEQMLTHAATFPLNKRSIEVHGNRFTRAENLVSNGAYKLKSWEPNAQFILSKNENYWDKEAVKIGQVRWYPMVDAGTQYNRYRAGEIDIMTSVGPGQFETIAKELPNELRVAPYLGLYYYGLNLTRAPFGDNLKLRKAISMAIDRETLVKRITGRGEVAAYSWVPPGMEGYKSAALRYAGVSRDEQIRVAKELYKEAGYSDARPLEFELRYNVSETEQKVAVAIQAMLRETLGARAELVNEEFKVLISNIQRMAITEAYRLSWIGDYADPDTFLQLMISNNPGNLTGYSNEQYDELMRLASNELSVERRHALLREAEQLMLDDHPAIPLYYYMSKNVVRETVGGWEDNILDRHPTRHLYFKEN